MAFSGVGAAHRVAVDLGLQPGLPRPLDDAFNAFLRLLRRL